MKLYTWERWTLGLILTAVGLLAGYVSIFHVATWTMQNSPPGTSIVAGLTNAAISELVPVAALIVYRVCRRHDRSTKLAVFLIVAAGALSLSAQLAVAKASLSGWVVSAAPMAAFMLLTKLVLSLLAPDGAMPHTQTRSRQAAKAASAPPLLAAGAARKRNPTPRSIGVARGRSQLPATGRAKTLPPSLTNAAKVAAAIAELEAGAPVKEVAARAGVSLSTVRRHLRPRSASASLSSPAETPSELDSHGLTAPGAK